MKKQRKRRVGWWITEQGERWFKEQEEERQRLEGIRENVNLVPLYTIPERTDGKPSINTAEGWEALKRRLEGDAGQSN